MVNLAQFLRLQNIFNPPVYGNDLPSQGGITGNLPIPPDMQGGFPMPAEQKYNPLPIPPNDGSGVMPDVKPGFNIPSPMGATPDYDVNRRMSELYHPETVASDRYNELVNAYPKREDYHPSMLRRIGGALMGVAGSLPQGRGMNFYKMNPNAVESGINFMDKPFLDKQEDWKYQIGPAGQAASNERYQNVNERSLAYQTVSNELKQQAQDAKAANDQRKLDIAEARAKVYEYKSRHPGMKFDFSGPTVKVADPGTGKVTDTGISTGHMSEIDKLNLQGDMRLEQIEATGAQARQTEGTRQSGRMDVAETRGWKPYEETLPDGTKRTFMYNEITGETRDKVGKSEAATPVSRSGSNRGELPSQTRVRRFNTAAQIRNTRPDLAPFIKYGPGASDFKVTQPGKDWFGRPTGPNAQQFAELNTLIYGNPEGIEMNTPVAAHGGPPTASGQMPQRITKTQRNVKTGQTRQVYSDDGGKTWLPLQ